MVETHPLDVSMPENIQAWLDILRAQASKNRILLNEDKNKLHTLFNQAIDLNIIFRNTSEFYNITALNAKQEYYYYKEMTRSCGAISFLCIQHYSSFARIANSKNERLKEQWINKKGEKFGTSYAHLRNTSNPPVVAIDTGDSYLVNGTLPYVTGYTIFNMLTVGFVSEDRELFALIPFCESTSFIVLKQLNLVAMNSANTVACQLINHKIDKSMVISDEKLGTFLNRANQRGAHLIGIHIGLALAVMDLIQGHRYLENPIVKTTYNFLMQEILNHEAQLLNLPINTPVVPLRMKCIKLLNEIFLFGEQVLKGLSTISDSNFIIIKEEAQVFAAVASTMDTLLETCNAILKFDEQSLGNKT